MEISNGLEIEVIFQKQDGKQRKPEKIRGSVQEFLPQIIGMSGRENGKFTKKCK